MLTLFSIGAYAQTQQGQSSFGFNLGYNFNDVGNATIGIDYRYCVTDAFRLTPSITHLVKNDGLSAWAIDMNAHYVFKLSEMFGFYPLAGLSLSFWKAGPWDATRFGANIGLGGEVYATDRISVGLEAKYNIIKDLDAAALAGLSLSFWKAGPWDATRFGANIGLGGEVYATDRISVGLEAKYNIIKDLDAAALAVRVGYNF